MKVLILGTNGYIGSHLSYYFSKVKGVEIFYFNRNSSNIKYLESIYFDFIFICIGNKNSQVIESESLMLTNLGINFLDKIKYFKYGKIIYISSCLLDFVSTSYTKSKFKIEKYLEDNFKNLIILRICILIGVNINKKTIFNFEKNLNMIPKLFLLSKDNIKDITIESNFLEYKREYLRINDFSKYFTNIENINNLECKIYQVGTRISYSGKEIIFKLSNTFNNLSNHLNKINYIISNFKGSDAVTNDLKLPNPDFKKVYSDYNKKYNSFLT